MSTAGPKFVDLTACILVLTVALGCENFERSQYHSGTEKQEASADLTPPVDGGPMGPEPTPIPTAPNPSGTKRDLEFDTGLPACLKDHLATTEGRYVAPIVLEKSLADFREAPVTGLADFEILADLILRRVVNAAGLVDYAALRGEFSGQWTKLINSLQSLDAPLGVDTSNAITFWINAYNLTMIDYIVNAPDATDVGRDLGFDIFDTKRQIAKHPLSLNDIEFGIIGLNGAPNSVPELLKVTTAEYRAHFAVVCGALSCPKLRNFLYRPMDLELMLTENTLLVANSSAFFAASGNTLVHSGLFNFYPNDFAKIFGDRFINMPNYLVNTCRADAEVLRALAGTSRRRATTYDWTINRQ